MVAAKEIGGWWDHWSDLPPNGRQKGPLYLDRGGVTGVGLTTGDEGLDMTELELETAIKLAAGRKGKLAGRGMGPGCLEAANIPKLNGGLMEAPAAAILRAADAAAAWR